MENFKITHNWANSVSDSGKGSHFSYTGTCLYSYGTLVANILTNKKGEKATVITTLKYSMSTSTHVNMAISASHTSIIYASYVPSQFEDNITHDKNIKMYIQNIKSDIDRIPNAKKITKYISSIQDTQAALKEYINFFSIKSSALIKLYTEENIYAKWDNVLKKEKKYYRSIERQKKQKEKKQFLKNEADFRSHKINHFYSDVHLLRISPDGQSIETSLQFEFSTNKGLAFYKWVKAIIKKGGCADCNKNFLGSYPVKEITSERITIGCHTILTKEYEAIALQLGWEVN